MTLQWKLLPLVFLYLFQKEKLGYNPIEKYLKAKGIEKVQIKYLLLGIILTFSLVAVCSFILVVVFNISTFVILGPVFSLILVASLAYAIVKHRFLDIRMVVARSVGYALLILVLALFYSVSFFLIGQLFLPVESTFAELTISTLLALVMAITFQPLRIYIQKVTNNIFYQDNYDPSQLLGKLGRIMATTILLEELTSEIIKELIGNLRITKSAFLLLKQGKLDWKKSEGFSDGVFSEKKLHVLVAEVDSHRKSGDGIVIFDELTEGKVKNFLREGEISTVVPLYSKEELIGLLILGEKSSGGIYTVEDIDFLEILSPELSIAGGLIKNGGRRENRIKHYKNNS